MIIVSVVLPRRGHFCPFPFASILVFLIMTFPLLLLQSHNLTSGTPTLGLQEFPLSHQIYHTPQPLVCFLPPGTFGTSSCPSVFAQLTHLPSYLLLPPLHVCTYYLWSFLLLHCTAFHGSVALETFFTHEKDFFTISSKPLKKSCLYHYHHFVYPHPAGERISARVFFELHNFWQE